MRTGALSLLLLCLSAEASEPRFQDVTVKKGDTLWGIAKTYLKDPAKWDEILKHNRLPSSDPAVALPGMTLKVPVHLIREQLRAAHMIYKLNQVAFRRKETASWRPAPLNMELYRGDSLRTLAASKAKVKFINADLLNLDADSLAIIKPVDRDYDVELKSGSVFAGRSRVVTASARITPKTKDTQYSAKVSPDLTTLVEVYTGVAAVEGQGKTVDVRAGMSSEVRLGLAPGIPLKIADLPRFEARAADFSGSAVSGQARLKIDSRAQLPFGAGADEINSSLDVEKIKGEVADLSVGLPISGYRVQASRAHDFDKIAFDKLYEAEEKIDLKSSGLAAGVYWWRVALIDLLGTEGNFSAPRLYSVGLARRAAELDLKSSLVVYKPARDEEVRIPEYKVVGVVKDNELSVTVNGKTPRRDENGNFYLDIRLQDGPNDVAVTVGDSSGNQSTLTRRIIYRP